MKPSKPLRKFNRKLPFVSKAESRLEVLEDFLWVINGENLPDKYFTTFPVTFHIVMEYNKYINFLDNQLFFNQDTKLYYDKAIQFEHKAEKEAKINKLTSLLYWQHAQESYEKACDMDPENLNHSLGFAKCLLNLSEYKQVIDLSDICPALNSSSGYWRLRSIAYFKHKKYKEATSCNTEALKLDHKNNLAIKYRKLIKKLDIKNTVNYRIDGYKRELKFELYYFKNSHNNDWSIDWWNNCRGLSVPSEIESYNDSDLTPIFSASELLNTYKNDFKKLFNKRCCIFSVPNKDNRLDMFTKYFYQTRLSRSLTELVIPAAYEDYSGKSHLFTTYDVRESESKSNEANSTFVDVLMATTAAPTFFSPHKIKNKGTFLDREIYLNNPALAAYDEAIRYKVADKKISVLSLGTGCYVPDPSLPNLYRDLLFWPQHPSMISIQEGDIDREMYEKLENCYQRWQIFFEEPIKFDDCESIPNLLELGHQYIEELDFSDENPINKLIESFEYKCFF
ncbi:5478_t:CDS:2 [Dentiscutata heterogama]|uniref:5478_t:CDS:1 n=1 Tax=Dentiscutata heterogama TaxID=1316150 RepID=A0ACA9M1K4_9GLOM|nr:5478_t:CDS:2 [Dentiscutata heterogama]